MRVFLGISAVALLGLSALPTVGQAPSRKGQEVLQATVVVLCTMFFLGLFLFLIDLLWTWLFSFIGFTEYNKKS